MLKVVQRLLVGGLVAIVALIATSGAASACVISFYQPEVPEELRK